ncbi:MAG: cytochrome c [Niabella sp.]
MKKYLLIGSVIVSGLLAGCGADKNPGYAYMPDMYYSVAYETYAPTDRLDKDSAHYTRLPVPGTVARGQDYAFTLKHDSLGYALSAQLKNPLDTAGADYDAKEAERLYLVNCAICHGDKLDGNGPLFNNGEGPYSAAPKNFMADDMKAMAAGTMFYSVTYGIRAMGSYASQLTPHQRWAVVKYIKGKQGGAAAAAPATATADSAAVAAK